MLSDGGMVSRNPAVSARMKKPLATGQAVRTAALATRDALKVKGQELKAKGLAVRDQMKKKAAALRSV